MGDGLNSLATAITLTSATLVLAGSGLLALFSRGAAETSRWRRRSRGLIIFTSAGVGAVAGICAVAATFYETTWRPPPPSGSTCPLPSSRTG